MLKNLRTPNIPGKNESSKSEELRDYYTDEEELERETNWVLKKKRFSRKRKTESSPEVAQTSAKETQNYGEQKRSQPKERPPPPINITGITNYDIVHTLMKTVTNKDYKITALNNNIWKINTPDSDIYRALMTKLKREQLQWFTYENKNVRPIKVMARGLHATCAKEDIIENLQQKELKILDATNIIKKEKINDEQGKLTISKRGLPLFMLTFDKKE